MPTLCPDCRTAMLFDSGYYVCPTCSKEISSAQLIAENGVTVTETQNEPSTMWEETVLRMAYR